MYEVARASGRSRLQQTQRRLLVRIACVTRSQRPLSLHRTPIPGYRAGPGDVEMPDVRTEGALGRSGTRRSRRSRRSSQFWRSEVKTVLCKPGCRYSLDHTGECDVPAPDVIEAILAVECPNPDCKRPTRVSCHDNTGHDVAMFCAPRIRAALSPKPYSQATWPCDCNGHPSCCGKPRTPEPETSEALGTTCATWCGKLLFAWTAEPGTAPSFCTRACRDAGQPLHPAEPEGGNR